MDIKTRIKQAIRQQGFTLEQVASKMKRPDGSYGLPQSALSQMLANGNPSYNKLEEIANIIGLSISELLKAPDHNKIICPYCGNVLRFSKDIKKHFNEFEPLTKAKARELVGQTIEWYSEDSDLFADDELNAIAVVKSFNVEKVHPFQTDSIFGPTIRAIVDDYGLIYDNGTWRIDENEDEVLTMNSYPIWFVSLTPGRFTLTRSRKYVNGWVVYDCVNQYVCTFRDRRFEMTAAFIDLKDKKDSVLPQVIQADVKNWLNANYAHLL